MGKLGNMIMKLYNAIVVELFIITPLLLFMSTMTASDKTTIWITTISCIVNIPLWHLNFYVVLDTKITKKGIQFLHTSHTIINSLVLKSIVSYFLVFLSCNIIATKIVINYVPYFISFIAVLVAIIILTFLAFSMYINYFEICEDVKYFCESFLEIGKTLEYVNDENEERFIQDIYTLYNDITYVGWNFEPHIIMEIRPKRGFRYHTNVILVAYHSNHYSNINFAFYELIQHGKTLGLFSEIDI